MEKDVILGTSIKSLNKIFSQKMNIPSWKMVDKTGGVPCITKKKTTQATEDIVKMKTIEKYITIDITTPRQIMNSLIISTIIELTTGIKIT